MSLIELPSTREEEWRWADPDAIAAAASLPWSDATEDAANWWLDLPGARIVVRDGVIDQAASTLDPITLRSIEAGDHALGQRATGPGWSLHLDAAAAAQPVQIVHVSTGGANHLPSEIVLAADVVAQVVETYVGAGWANRYLRVTLGATARLMRSVRLLQAGGFTSLREDAALGTGASLVTIFLGAGQAGTRIDATIVAGEGAYADYGGALLTAGDQRQECAVAVRHAQPNGSSQQVWRAVAGDRSTASLVARVEVARDAQKTDGVQSLRGLLLKRTATVNLKPELEIFADDVKCAHGATVGELDARALFYMQSRGIPHARAQALLTTAFVADALDRIGDETVRAAFSTDAETWLDRAL
ncbi:SufBD protein [Sphingomonas sp. Leaf339]|uniref:SufD family Fe-S cluster assembly protein n=1 Tax=Sphingomonas sp. Leaf339 TaxID=1736343 RepID=UPI0006FBB08A|nr:SufD family Fe-S cluster assembly protein [Sphingomonas sp. Leaf339]KQU62115.1 SufBD protein [Sphingomonas sp. Leaf339]